MEELLMTPERELYLKDRYLRILYTGANLTELCDFTASCIGAPVAITLPTQTIIASSKDYTSELIAEYRSVWNLCSQEELKEMEKTLNDLLITQAPVIRAWPYSRYKRINCGCTWHGKLLAVLDCPIVDNKLDDDAPYIVGMAAPVILMALRLNSYIDANTVNPMQTYLIALLQGQINEYQQRQHIYNTVLKTAKSWHVLMCEPVGDTKFERIKSSVYSFCIGHDKIWCVEYGGNIIMLTDGTSKEKLLPELESECRGLYRIGVSVPFDNIYDVAGHLGDVRLALQIAAFAEDEASMIYVQKYKIHIHFLSVLQPGASCIVNPALEEIKKYDAEHESEYFPTLKAYLLCKRDFKRVADMLHIHKNTAVYRIQRVAEWFHLDFKDNCTIASLYLSLFADIGFMRERRLKS
jgi:hypothetical protein